MSEPGGDIERWELPSFEPQRVARVDPAAVEAAARKAGFAQGQAEGMAQGLAEAARISAQLGQMLDGMARPYESLDGIVGQELLGVVVAIAREVVKRELTVDSSVLAATVAEAVAVLGGIEQEVEIYVHPSDGALLRQIAPDVLDGRPWKLVEDMNLLAGGCRLRTPVSFVDATIERQISDLAARLLEVPAAEDDD